MEEITPDIVLKILSDKPITFKQLMDREEFSHIHINQRVKLLANAIEKLELKSHVNRTQANDFSKLFEISDDGTQYLTFIDKQDFSKSLKMQEIDLPVNEANGQTDEKAKGVVTNKPASEIKAKTFICYSRADLDYALNLAEGLRKAGFNIWMDQLDILPGQRWAREVDRALHNCENFLVILSPTSIESDNVDDEISVAIDEKKRIIPIMISNCRTPLRLRAFQYIDCTKDYDSGFKRLSNTLEDLKDGSSL